MNFLGIIVAIGCVITAMLLEGGHPSALLNAPAFLIVIAGTTGCVMVQYPIKVFIGALAKFKWLIKPPFHDLAAQVTILEGMATLARQQGLLALENEISKIDEPFLSKGIQMVVDGVDKEQLVHLLENEIEFEQHQLEQSAKVYEAFGGYAPTMGILGAVLGLIHAMGLLDKPDQLGPAIAVAFIATIYGVGSCNIIFLPTGNRFKNIAHDIGFYKNMILEGILSIASGENALQLKRRMEVYLEAHH